MSTRFFETQTLDLTPLTPIHIGCGIDFEPTNYVIDDGVLFHFDPAQVPLDARAQQELAAAVEGSSALDVVLRVQRFFSDRASACAGSSRSAVTVTPGVEQWYQARVGKVVQREADGAEVGNNLAIERCAHHPHTDAPYLPGSSLKGSIRTGWLNSIDDVPPVSRDTKWGPRKDEAKQLERELLGGSFQTDPFRFLDLADASGDALASEIVFAVNRDKEVKIDRRTGQPREKDLFVRREVICGGQYRALKCEWRMDRFPDRDFRDSRNELMAPAVRKRLPPFEALASAVSDFYLSRLECDLEVLTERRFCDDWLGDFRQLMGSLRSSLERGERMLLRVGRHSGAEAVTIANHRWFFIKGAGRPPRNYWDKTAKTLWLAGARSIDRVGLLPFGWILVEPGGAPELPALREWCDRQPKPDLAAVRARLEQARAQAAELVRRVAEADAKRRAEAEAKALAERAEQERVKALRA